VRRPMAADVQPDTSVYARIVDRRPAAPDGHIQYTIKVRHEGTSYLIDRRYSEMRFLHGLLKSLEPELADALPPLPGRRTGLRYHVSCLLGLRAPDAGYLDERTHLLDAYVAALSAEVPSFFLKEYLWRGANYHTLKDWQEASWLCPDDSPMPSGASSGSFTASTAASESLELEKRSCPRQKWNFTQL